MENETQYKKIVVPTDCSGWSNRAIPYAVDIARHHDAEIILLFVFKPPASEYVDNLSLAGQEQQIQELRENYKQQLMAIRNQLRQEDINVRVQFLEGPAVSHLICDYINAEEIDLVVMSTHGRTGLARFLFGTVASRVMECAKVPVFLVRPDKDDK